MIFDCLQNLFPRVRMTRGSVRRQAKTASRAVEVLERRRVLTPFYDLTVLASTSGGQFTSFGDLVSINDSPTSTAGDPFHNPFGTVAFVGNTDVDHDGVYESGLWTVNSQLQLTNVNPDSSTANGRDFGRAVGINNDGILVARDRYFDASGEDFPSLEQQAVAQPQFYVRIWDSNDPNFHVNIASAGSANEDQPDYGKYSILQTFTDINNDGDVVFVAQNLDKGKKLILYKGHNSTEVKLVSEFEGSTIPRPQLTSDGRVLYRASADDLQLWNPSTNKGVNVAEGFGNLGYAPGISDDGRLISFIGDGASGYGVYLAYRYQGGGYKTVRIATVGEDDWAAFSPTSAVRVNNTLLYEEGATVAFEGVHGRLGRGIYTTRVSFIDDYGPTGWDVDLTKPYVNGAVPVVRVTDQIGSGFVEDLRLWNGINDRNRGELAFWVKTSTGESIVRAEPYQVVKVDFTPSQASWETSTIRNTQLLAEFGIDHFGWEADFAATMQAQGLSSLATPAAQTAIVNQIQSYFLQADARVHVVGRPSDPPIEFVTYDATPDDADILTIRGAFQTVYVGSNPGIAMNGKAHLGLASPTYDGQGGLDYFNQVTDDSAVVFANRIFEAGYLFSDPQSVPFEKLVQGISAIIAHEIGHNFGLFHLEDNLASTLGQIMRTRTPTDSDLTHDEAFSNATFPRESYTNKQHEEVTPGNENSAARLRFGVGYIHNTLPLPKEAEDEALDADGDSLRANLPYSPTGQGPTVARMLLGTVDSSLGEFLPVFEDLGQGAISQVLASAKLATRPGTGFILLGSTDGIRLDIVGIPHGSALNAAGVVATYLGITTNPDLQLTFDPDGDTNDFQLYHLPAAGAPVLMGTAAIQNVAELDLLIDGAAVSSGASYSLGETTPGGGALSRVITIQNGGAGTLNLGTVTITGTGYSVSQPAQTTLLPGQSTTLTLTLSDSVAGFGLQGQLTIPSNDPSGTFQLTFSGSVDSRPRVLGVTRIDNGTGPVRVQIDFSGLLQGTPAGVANYYTISDISGDALPVVSAVYTATGAVSHVVLTSSVSASTLPSGNYDVRIDGTQVRAANGAPLATSGYNLLSLQAYLESSVVIIGANGSGQAAILDGPSRTGVAPPEVIQVQDLNGDGILDYVATARFTGELVFHWGQQDGGYRSEILTLPRANPDVIPEPTSLLTADWNEDGNLDVIVYDNASDYFLGGLHRILIYLNDGSGHFTPAADTPIPVSEDLIGPLLGVRDFNGDGAVDVAIAGPDVDGEGSVAIYGKDTFLGYGQIAVYPTGHFGWYPQSALQSDLNNDGRLDLIVATGGFYGDDPRPVVYLATANGLVLADDLEYEGEVGDVAVGDFTGDGNVDLVVISDYYSVPDGIFDGVVISLLVGNGAGQFAAEPNIILHRRNVTLATSGDVNQDGKLDLVLRADPFEQGGFDTTSEYSVWTLLGDGFGGFDLTAPLTPLAPTNDVLAGNFILRDLTGDGYPELTFGNLATGQIGLFANDGAGHLNASTAGPVSSTITAFHSQFDSEHGVIVADVNRDGFPDQLRIVTGAGTFQKQAVDVFWGNADGTFDVVSSITVDPLGEQSPENYSLGDLGFMRAGDLNNDGWLDILLGADNATGSPLAVYLGIDGKNFAAANPFLVDGGPGVHTFMGELVDVNNDGNLDYVGFVSANVGMGIAVFFGDGTGKLTYNSNSLMAIPGFIRLVSPTLADFNGDHKLDMAFGTSEYNGSEYVEKLLIYNGLGNGKFTLGQTVIRSAGDSGPQLFINDVNHDGKLDIITSSDGDGSLNFYLGTGNGQFIADSSLKLAVGYPVSQALFADLNGDGLDDLAITKGDTTTDQYVSTVAIFSGDGVGHFGEPQQIDTGTIRPKSLALIPTAGMIEAGSFAILHPVLTVPAGVGNISVSTAFETAVAINPRPLINPYTQDPYLIAVVTAPTHGKVTVQSQGTLQDLSDDTFSYLPEDGFSGTDTFTYDAVDGQGGTITRTVTITVTPKNQNPIVTVTPGTASLIYINQYQSIDPNATVSDTDSTNFNGGKLTAVITSGQSSADSLIIDTFAAGPGSISVEFDNSVYYAGKLIGTVKSGYNGDALIVQLTTADATAAAVTALVSRISYFYFEELTQPLQRTMSITLTDGDGGSTTVSKAFTVTQPNSNVEPTLTPSAAETTYSAGGAPVAIDSGMTVSDSDSPNFANGFLSVNFSFGRQANDVLAIRSVGTGVGQININGNEVRSGSIVFGQISEFAIDDLPIDFNSNATPALVQALIRQITFSNTSSNPDTSDRRFRFRLYDGSSDGVAEALQIVTFGSPIAAPEIDLSNGSTAYPGNQSAIVIDSGATVSDSDSTDFAGGTLTISLLAGASPDDRLGIRNQGTDSGQINISGNSVKFGATMIGTYTGGFTDDSDLVIDLNSNATPTTVQALIRNITFAILDSTPSTTSRQIQFVLDDGDGGTSTAVEKTVTVTVTPPGNPAPTLQLPSANPTYSKAAAPVAVDAGAIVLNPASGSGTLAAGVLTVSINDVNTGRKKLDILSLSSLNGIGVSRGTQLVGGRLVTIYDLNSNVTAQTVQNAIRGINFKTSGKGLKTTTRSVKIQLEDSDGDKSAEVTKTINVSKKKVKVARTRDVHLVVQTD